MLGRLAVDALEKMNKIIAGKRFTLLPFFAIA